MVPRPKLVPRPETYSVVVNSVKVQELLFALARDAKLNIDVHPGIAGVVTLNAIDQTLQQLLGRLSKQVDMRWELDGPNLIVTPDSPYLRVYKIDYVNMERQTQGQVGVATQISTPGGTGAGGGGGNTSTTSVRNQSNNKFWETLVENIKDILRETDKVLPGGPGAPQAAAQPTPPAGVIATLAQAAAGGQPGATPTPPAAPAGANTSFREAASVISNPESGVITIRATSRQHEKIQEFLDQVLHSARRQVMIEATIAEVQLNNSYQQGIDWSLLRRGPSGINIAQAAAGNTLAQVNSSLFIGSIVDPNFRLGNISATLRLLESFGNVRILSSPKISVLNNQTAILKAVDNKIYFTIKADTSANQTTTQTTFTTTPNVVPVGFVMNVTPQISDTENILLNIKPTVSRIIGYVNDPNPSLANPCGIGVANCGTPSIVSRLPEIQTREMESIIKVNSGQVAVMGGLIEESVRDNEDGVPGLDRTGLGALFAHRNLGNTKSELVIFIRPLLVKDASIDGDYRAFRTFAPDENFLATPNPGKSPLRDGEKRP